MDPAHPDERFVVLGASYPPRAYTSTADSHEIAAAAKAFIGAAFQQNWKILFGGHPTISPLVLMIAREYGTKHSVLIYQSKFFANHLGPATLSLAREQYGEIILIENDLREAPPRADETPDPTKCPKSLLLMRKAMLSHSNIGALVLIGGDTGLIEEFELFRTMLPGRPIFPIGFPGGAARDIAPVRVDHDLQAALVGSRNYLFLCSRIMQRLSPKR